MTTRRTPLSETKSSDLLARHGVPMAPARVANTPAQAAVSAAALGYPVVIKGEVSGVAHKTETGLVALNLPDEKALLAAAKRMAQAADAPVRFRVQPYLSGKRELMAGLTRDPTFGPVVLFGLGGVAAEALNEVALRLAPLTRADAEQMLDQTAAARFLDEFRGDAPADRETLIAVLLGLSELAVARPDVLEVDINPLIVGARGVVQAVDALVVTGKPDDATPKRPPVDIAHLGAIFHPHSVAFIGASDQFGKWGHLLLSNVISGGFTGKVHLVNHKGKPIAGRKTYRSVTEIEEPVDLAVITLPATLVEQTLEQLGQKGIKHAVLITSGFSEIGPEGRELEQRIVDKAVENNVCFLGPNTMGICNPHKKFYLLGAVTHPKPGSTALISQSGNMGVQLLTFAENQGLGIRAFGGSGNEAMIAIEDFIESFEADEKTRTVVLYVESVKNGRRFFEATRRVGRIKPIVLLHGGITDAGGRAAASHTGALASDARVFEAACRQAGVVMVESPMDMLDIPAALSSLPLPKGRRVAIMTLGGGWGVVTSDLCARHKLSLPPLSPDLIAQFDQWLPPYWSRANPVDLVGDSDLSLPDNGLEALMAWEGCDAVLDLGIIGRSLMVDRLIEATLTTDPSRNPEELAIIRTMGKKIEQDHIAHTTRLMEKYEKPVLGVSLLSDSGQRTLHDVEGCIYSGLFFPSPERAVRALAKMCDYRDFLKREEY
ncbi:MAG: acetate--CoA ligase family protein [Thermodesulfobacteriota bacterium]|nr:acetate--CoA ligase family protein [Thermodesulfobacteriota bacterium]